MLRWQLARGEEYEKLKDVVVINILNFSIFKGTENVHTVWKFAERKHPELGSLDGLEIHFLELEKFRNSNPDLRDKLNQWLTLIDTENEKWLEVAMEKNKKIKESIKKVNGFLSDDEIRDIIEAQEKWEMDYRSSMSDAKRKGRAELEKEGKDIIKKLLSMDVDSKKIAKATGLNEEDILKLK